MTSEQMREKVLTNAERTMAIAHKLGGLDAEMDSLTAAIGDVLVMCEWPDVWIGWALVIEATDVLMREAEKRVAGMKRAMRGM